jgi:excisionase family DNA binding protein
MDAVPLEPLLTVSDVARLLRISRSEVYLLVQTGKLAAADVPYRKTLFRPTDIASLMAGAS